VKNSPKKLPLVRQLPGIFLWIGLNLPLLMCLLWYPLTIGFYGTSFSWLGRALLRSLGLFSGGIVPSGLFALFALVYSIAIMEGCLVGMAWAARRRWIRGRLWEILFLGIVLGLQIAEVHTLLFGLFALIGLVALCSQGLGRRHLFLVFTLLVVVGLLAFCIGATGAFLTAVVGPSSDSLTFLDWVVVISLEIIIPLCLLIGSAILSARHMRRALQD
jgi:hypothetical protein